MGTFWGWLITSPFQNGPVPTAEFGLVMESLFRRSNIKQHESEGRLAQSAERKAKNLEVVGLNLGFLHFLTLCLGKKHGYDIGYGNSYHPTVGNTVGPCPLPGSVALPALFCFEARNLSNLFPQVFARVGFQWLKSPM